MNQITPEVFIGQQFKFNPDQTTTQNMIRALYEYHQALPSKGTAPQRNLREELTIVMNVCGVDTAFDIPDFVLAMYLDRCLATLSVINEENTKWHGFNTDFTVAAPTATEITTKKEIPNLQQAYESVNQNFEIPAEQNIFVPTYKSAIEAFNLGKRMLNAGEQQRLFEFYAKGTTENMNPQEATYPTRTMKDVMLYVYDEHQKPANQHVGI